MAGLPCCLNPCDTGLSLRLSDGNCCCTSISEGGLAYCFGGSRGTVGIRPAHVGRWVFGCIVGQPQEVSVRDTEHLKTSCVMRIGVSQAGGQVNRLGELRPSEVGLELGRSEEHTEHAFYA